MTGSSNGRHRQSASILGAPSSQCIRPSARSETCAGLYQPFDSGVAIDVDPTRMTISQKIATEPFGPSTIFFREPALAFLMQVRWRHPDVTRNTNCPHRQLPHRWPNGMHAGLAVPYRPLSRAVASRRRGGFSFSKSYGARPPSILERTLDGPSHERGDIIGKCSSSASRRKSRGDVSKGPPRSCGEPGTRTCPL